MPTSVRALAAFACCVTALATAVAPVSAQDPTAHPRVRQALRLAEVWLDAQRDYMEIPGLSVGFVHDQQLLWSAGFGYADRERQVPATPSTLYSICSISKLFTSIGVMQLRDQGRLRLDDDVAQHLDWFRIRRTDSLAPGITIAGLLTHSSGLPRESAHAYWTGPDFLFPARDEIVAQLPTQETLYPASQYFQYSNLGITLAGEVISALSGQPYDEYMRRRVLEPLGMTSTFTDMPDGERGGRLAVGYSAITRNGDRTPVPFFTARGIAPAAGYASNVEDLARFISWQLRVLERGAGDAVLGRNTLREMQRVHWVDPDHETMWGLGFSVWRENSRTLVGHGGSCPGFRSNLAIVPAERTGVVVLANAQGVNTSQLADGVYGIIGPVVRAAVRDTAATRRPADTSLALYAGGYESGFAGEIAIVEWEDGLASVGLPTTNPMQGLTKLRKVGEHTFRRMRRDESLGETVVFELGPDGQVTRLVWNNNHFRRVR